MTEHGGNEEIAGGDATQRDRVAKAAQEAFYDLGTGVTPETAWEHVMSAYDGPERERFGSSLGDHVGQLVEDFQNDEADEQGFVEGLLDEYERRHDDEDPWATERADAIHFLDRYAAHHSNYGANENANALMRAATILRGHAQRP